MSEVTVGEIIGVADKIGVIALLFIIGVSGARKKWVFYWFHEERVADLREAYERTIADLAKQLIEAKVDGKEWRTMALAATDIGKRVVKVAEEKSLPNE
jgi:hypothetical protein